MDIIIIFLLLIVIGSNNKNKNIFNNSRQCSNIGNISIEKIIKNRREQINKQNKENKRRILYMGNVEYVDRILNDAIEKFGNDSQLNLAIEEMSELIKEICKNKRDFKNDDKILEEMADVYIMLYQLQIIFDIEDDNLNNMILRKVKRLEEKIKCL